MAGTAFPAEPLVPFSGWREFPSYYGPLWSWLEACIDLVAGPRNLLANLLGFKLLALAALLCDAWLIGQITARRAPERMLENIVFFAWNPLVIFEAAANAHNDLIMLVFVLAALLAWERGRWIWAVIGMALAVVVKVSPLPLLGLVGVAAVAQVPGWAGRLSRAALAAWLAAGLITLAYLTFPQGLDSALVVWTRANMFTNSLPALVMLLLHLVIPRSTAEWLARSVALCALLMFFMRQAWQTWQAPEKLARFSLDMILFLLLFVTLWFQPWYVLWAVALAAICPPDEPQAQVKRMLTSLFSLSVTWSYVVYGFIWFWFVPQMNWGNMLGVQALGFAVTYILPLTYLAWHSTKVS